MAKDHCPYIPPERNNENCNVFNFLFNPHGLMLFCTRNQPFESDSDCQSTITVKQLLNIRMEKPNWSSTRRVRGVVRMLQKVPSKITAISVSATQAHTVTTTTRPAVTIKRTSCFYYSGIASLFFSPVNLTCPVPT